MPELSERLFHNGEVPGFSPVDRPTAPPAQPSTGTANRATLGFRRCPVPPVWSSNPTTLGQFNAVNSKVPRNYIWATSLTK